MLKIITFNPLETEKIGQRLAGVFRRYLQKNPSTNLIVGLYGDLGGGKTTFVKGVATGLGIKEIITSPTFTLLKEYKISGVNLYHFDFYRLKNTQEALNLGFEEYLKRPRSIILIEWADRVDDILPKEKLIVEFDFINQNRRKIILSPEGKKYENLIYEFKNS